MDSVNHHALAVKATGHLQPCRCNACLDAVVAALKSSDRWPLDRPQPLRLSDSEQQLLDELRGDWPPADADLDTESDPAEWGPWSDDYVFVPTDDRDFIPSAEDMAWVEHELNRHSTRYDVVSRSMIHPELARALATGRLTSA